RPAGTGADTGGAQRGERGAVPGLLPRYRLGGADRAAAAAARAARVPGGGRVPAVQQGVEPGVLAVAGTAGGASAAAVAAAAGLDGGGRLRVGAADVLLPGPGGQGSAAGLVPG